MIQGQFSRNGQLWFVIDLIAINTEAISVNVLLDTGFTGWLAINNQDLIEIGWHLIDTNRPMQTAQGETLFDVYEGTVVIDGQQFTIPVLGGDEIQEILIGVPWLLTRRLVVDFPLGVLTLG
jgi:clan AA aspartic protease